MEAAKRKQLIDRYKDGVGAVAVAAESLSEADLDRKPAHAGWSAHEFLHNLRDVFRPHYREWSARQVVHDLVDAELMEAVHLRRMLAENTPVLQHWDEERYAQRLHYDRPITGALAAFKATALQNIELLEQLTDAEWKREGNQERPWPLTVDGWLEEKVEHLHQRLMQILNAVGSGKT
jgi:hypothetical protein